MSMWNNDGNMELINYSSEILPEPFVVVAGYFKDLGWAITLFNSDPSYSCWIIHHMDPNKDESQRKDGPISWIALPE